jgi:uncharacterized secreted repeat protein (TIGR03808 family)
MINAHLSPDEVRNMNRRNFLGGMAAFAAAAAPARAASPLLNADMRGSINAADLGIRPGAFDDQSRIFERILNEAAASDQAVFLPPGIYMISNLKLPRRVRLNGVTGASRIVYGGEGHLLVSEDSDLFELRNIVIDGQNRALADYSNGLIECRRVGHVVIDECEIIGGSKNGISLETAKGRVERNQISGANDAGIYSVEAAGLSISDNVIEDCANGGILVHRWQIAEDATIVSGNRVSRIRAGNGGTGQYGNGINVFRAANVQIANNQVSDCAFSAIRSNSGNNVQILGNNCVRSGETAIYSEFAFEGAVIANNVVQGGANGISVANFNEGGRMSTVTGNLIRDLSSRGPYEADPPGFGMGISVEADTAVSSNVIENAPLFGINLGWGPYLRNVSATGNVIRNVGEGIAVSVVDGAGPAVISDNVIQGAKKGAILGHKWADVVSGDMALHGNQGFAHVTVERNRAG